MFAYFIVFLFSGHPFTADDLKIDDYNVSLEVGWNISSIIIGSLSSSFLSSFCTLISSNGSYSFANTATAIGWIFLSGLLRSLS